MGDAWGFLFLFFIYIPKYSSSLVDSRCVYRKFYFKSSTISCRLCFSALGINCNISREVFLLTRVVPQLEAPRGSDACKPNSFQQHSLHTNPLRHPMLRIKHPRRRSNDLQRTQNRSSSINRFAPRVAIMPYRYHQRRRTRLLGPLFCLRLRGTVDLLRPVFAPRRNVNGLHGHDGLLLRFFLQRLLRLRLLFLLIGDSQGADSTLRSAPLSLPYLFLSFSENIANILFCRFYC